MTDYTLKFKTEAEATEVLDGYEGSVDTIGEIPDAVGWHVNTRGPKNAELEKFMIEVATPYRIWA
jgi:hypothetical protein